MRKTKRTRPKPRTRPSALDFTAQESRVFEAIVREGMSNPEIARKLKRLLRPKLG
jgi:DNA-binding NarL/FixJ family response regulator